MAMHPLSPDVRIIRALQEAGNNFCSGQDLAHELGISRVAIWKRLQNLEEEGFRVEAVRRKGYRLTESPSHSTETGILARLPADTPLQQLSLLESTASTNNEVMRLLATGAKTPLACITRLQPEGKGRRGRSWSGTSPDNFYGSLGFRPSLPPRQIGLLTIWTGLRICRRLAEETKLPIRLKWPNDLYLNDRKIAGILAESTLETDRITSLVIGIGMNVNITEEAFPLDLRETATSLRVEAGQKFCLATITAQIIDEVLGAVTDCVTGIDEDRLADDWEEFACYLGQPVTILSSGDETSTGILYGIDRAGSLLLRNAEGRIQSFRAGDVSLRPAEPS